MDRWALVSLVCVGSALAAMVGVSAGVVPQPSFGEPVWYGLVALVVGYWLAVVRWAEGA
jgi:hypothetical protein